MSRQINIRLESNLSESENKNIGKLIKKCIREEESNAKYHNRKILLNADMEKILFSIDHALDKKIIFDRNQDIEELKKNPQRSPFIIEVQKLKKTYNSTVTYWQRSPAGWNKFKHPFIKKITWKTNPTDDELKKVYRKELREGLSITGRQAPGRFVIKRHNKKY
jgi:hypothetical protein